MLFRTIALCLIAVGLLWWRYVDARLKQIPRGGARGVVIARVLIGVFVAVVIVFPQGANALGHFFPAPLPAAGFIWHVLVLPVTVGVLVVLALARKVMRKPAPVNLERRRFLTVAAAAVPPLVTVGITGVSVDQLGKFRVRELDVAVDRLPEALRGFTIALVADVHTGPFSTPQMLEDVVERTNSIHRGGPADLVVYGGDLINTTLDDLPAGLEMAKALRGRLGMVACIGNHDVMDDEEHFVRRVRNAGVALLQEEVMTIDTGAGKIQVLGVDWAIGDEALFQSTAVTAAKWDGVSFPICLAHHPHAWDEAVRQGLPLVLSGHTHGGQIMLTDRIGAGPLKFRYWTGVHRRAGSTLVISNGVGNWFPLRVNAPAEILKLTLIPATNKIAATGHI